MHTPVSPPLLVGKLLRAEPSLVYLCDLLSNEHSVLNLVDTQMLVK